MRNDKHICVSKFKSLLADLEDVIRWPLSLKGTDGVILKTFQNQTNFLTRSKTYRGVHLESCPYLDQQTASPALYLSIVSAVLCEDQSHVLKPGYREALQLSLATKNFTLIR